MLRKRERSIEVSSEREGRERGFKYQAQVQKEGQSRGVDNFHATRIQDHRRQYVQQTSQK
jgi:hypothetical protein